MFNTVSMALKRALSKSIISAAASASTTTTTTTKTKAITAFKRAFLVCNLTNQTTNNSNQNSQKDVLKNYYEFLAPPSSGFTASGGNMNTFQRYYHNQPKLVENCKNYKSEYIQTRNLTTTTSLQVKKTENLTNKKDVNDEKDKKDTKPSSKSSSSPPLIIKNITKNLVYFTQKPIGPVDKNTLKFDFEGPEKDQKRPLCIMFAWMSASKAHLMKYVRIYTNLGFDTIAICITPWQLLFPVKGAQVIAADFLKFLENNQNNYEPIVIHGFSVGGYLCGEILIHVKKDYARYENLLNKFYAQIWDSAADVPEIPSGFPAAVFPHSPKLQKILRKYIIFHMKLFDKQATQHYIRSSQHFHFTLIKAPALFLVSKNDPIGAEKSNLSVKNDWESVGVKCTWKCWDRSSHVSHYKHHTDEYMQLVMGHLEENVLKRMRENNMNNQIKTKI